jgi:hypothetical protein
VRGDGEDSSTASADLFMLEVKGLSIAIMGSVSERESILFVDDAIEFEASGSSSAAGSVR